MTEPALSFARLALKPLLLAGGLAAAGFVLRNLSAHTLPLRFDRLGPVALLVIGAVISAVGVPRQVIAFAGGLAHGIWFGGALALAAQLLGCVLDLVWARLIARDWVRALLDGRYGMRLAKLDRVLKEHPFVATLTLRLLPVGNNLLTNLLAGGFGVKPLPFLAGSAIGYLPQTAVFVLLGAGVRVNRALELCLSGAALVASMLLGSILLRRIHREGLAA